MAIERKSAAIMFTDIAGYTEAMSESEQKALEMLRKKRSIIKPLIDNHQGTYVKEIGDGTLSYFESGYNASSCAKDLQRETTASRGHITHCRCIFRRVYLGLQRAQTWRKSRRKGALNPAGNLVRQYFLHPRFRTNFRRNPSAESTSAGSSASRVSHSPGSASGLPRHQMDREPKPS